ncbi:MAG TPA: hypothetical protein VD972_00890 [Hyalangium sp.]|nr:hypothetical protein [Hyalangium sp.]
MTRTTRAQWAKRIVPWQRSGLDEALPDVMARVKERFPRLRVLVVNDSSSFEETLRLDE